MTENSNSYGRRARAYGEWVVRWRWVLLVVSVLVAMGAASGARNLAFDNDYRVFFSKENPQLQAFEELQRTYTKIDNVLFAVAARDGGELTPEVLQAIETLTVEAWKLPFVLRVDSITNHQHTTADEDDLVVADLIEGADTMSEAELASALDIALHEPNLRERLIAADGQATGVNVTFQMPETDIDEVPRAMNASRELAARIEAEYPVTIHLSGMVAMNNAFFEASMSDMGTLVPFMYLTIIVFTFVLLRSISATIVTVAVIFLSVMSAMGIAGWIGIRLTPPSSAAPTIIMTLAVADSIHILITLLAVMRKRGLAKRPAIIESMRQNLLPVFLTSATTAVGFLSLNFSDSPPFAHLGNITAMGVMAAFFFSVTFLPAFLAVVPVRPKRSLSEFGGALERLGHFITSRNQPILVGSVVVALALIAFIPANELNDDFVKYFEEGTIFRAAVDFTSEELTGAYQLQYSLESSGSNGVADPEFLKRAHAFTEWLRAQSEVRQVSSITDTFHRLNQNLHGDDPSYYKLPETRELTAQYLLLYELSLPYGLDLNNQLDVDKSSTQIVATLSDMSARELREIALRGEEWLLANGGFEATGISPAVMFAYISDRNVRSMLFGTFIAVIVISGILIFALRSTRLGVLSLIPNLLPAGMAFGFWGMVRGEVNVAVSMVSGMTLGIVVDDTVHFLAKYLAGRREHGLSPVESIHYAFANVGRAIVVTSIILVAGFTVLAQSSFAMNSYMATLTAIAIVFALVADFFLLPVLLLATDRERLKSSEQPVVEPAESPASA